MATKKIQLINNNGDTLVVDQALSCETAEYWNNKPSLDLSGDVYTNASNLYVFLFSFSCTTDKFFLNFTVEEISNNIGYFKQEYVIYDSYKILADCWFRPFKVYELNGTNNTFIECATNLMCISLRVRVFCNGLSYNSKNQVTFNYLVFYLTQGANSKIRYNINSCSDSKNTFEENKYKKFNYVVPPTEIQPLNNISQVGISSEISTDFSKPFVATLFTSTKEHSFLVSGINSMYSVAQYKITYKERNSDIQKEFIYFVNTAFLDYNVNISQPITSLRIPQPLQIGTTRFINASSQDTCIIVGTTSFYNDNTVRELLISPNFVLSAVPFHFTDTAFFYNGAVQSSDIRYKNNIKDLPELLPEVSDLKTFTYNWKDEPKLTLGVSAQELQEKPTLGLLVSKDVEDTLSVNYSKLSVVALKCIQEQQKQIEELKHEVQELKTALS